MMSVEFDAFAEALRLLEGIFAKKLADGLVKVYWTALRDLPLEAVKAGIERHIRYGKFFPKPAELRRQDEKPRNDLGLTAAARRSVHIALMELAEQDPQHNGHLKDALARNAASWREFEARDPQLAEIENALARAGRILAVDPPDSPQYVEAVAADRRLRVRRETLLERRREQRAAA